MIRKGRFALWGNKEYELISYQQDYYLRSKNPADMQFGFREIKGNERAFIKLISVEELDDAYEVIPYAMISSYRFALVGCDEKTGKVMLVTVNPFVKEKMDVRPYGKSEYIIEVPLEEITIEEDRVPILGFEGLNL
ncbi:hypothetical protein [Sporosarcina sp. YIM B06819]|uniref:hypothetical protein n=1 Tax=Sporosarcina sp. YIM B06819 TaxID=3081769 RepID=UPI00298D2ABE|nr:hypothetical protein [Sporosarcina sp. YIM B06819]